MTKKTGCRGGNGRNQFQIEYRDHNIMTHSGVTIRTVEQNDYSSLSLLGQWSTEHRKRERIGNRAMVWDTDNTHQDRVEVETACLHRLATLTPTTRLRTRLRLVSRVMLHLTLLKRPIVNRRRLSKPTPKAMLVRLHLIFLASRAPSRQRSLDRAALTNLRLRLSQRHSITPPVSYTHLTLPTIYSV